MAAVVVLATISRGAGSSDRAGGVVRPRTVVLSVAAHETGADARDWAAAVERLSHGSLRIVVKGNWRRRQVDYERDTLDDVHSGKVDLATIPVRAYDTLGVAGFQ